MIARRATRAKINLTLRLLGRRDDGYHLLHSLVAFADIGDIVGMEPANGLSLVVSGPYGRGIGGDDNLVLRAARAMGVTDVALRLEKNLPVASGIGGGSGDAAATIRLINEELGLGLDQAELDRRAATLGADVPVCLRASACWMRGIGETVEPLGAFPAVAAVLVNPGVACPTGPVFAATRLAPTAMPDSPEAFDRPSLDAYLQAHPNDLQDAATMLVPEIGRTLDALSRSNGARHARMSGSGATCFALFDDLLRAEAAATEIARQRPDWWVVPTLLS